MVIFLSIFKICIANVYILSPDILSVYNIQSSKATFGNPYLYPTYGILVFIKSLMGCRISTQLPPNSYAIIYNYGQCFYSDLALSVQNQGGIGAIFTNINSFDYAIKAKNPQDGNKVNILVIGINTTYSNLLSQYSDLQIWIYYKFETVKSLAPVINLELSSNYTQDKLYIAQILSINISISKPDFILSFSYCTSCRNINFSADCITNTQATIFCLPHTSNVSGSDMLLNTFGIINYYESYAKTRIGGFLKYLSKLYKTCEFDYTTECHSSVLLQYGASLDTSSVFNKYSKYENEIRTLFYINSVSFFYPSYIEQAYCLSFYSVPSSCPACSPGCSNTDLYSSSCVPSCNVSACGNQNLVCLEKDRCYNFMIGDGNCNYLCNNDPDCKGVCVPGCKYIDLSKGLCPAQCSGKCFTHCSPQYCSPGCLYSDLSSGYCDPQCSLSCLDKCITNQCSPGCYYTDMASGLCPMECAGPCFQSCPHLYCSPGCLYSDLYSGKCSTNCTSSCLILCNKDSTSIYCSPGCLYSDLASGRCPSSCTSSCLDLCTDSCSPGCYYSNMTNGLCPVECSGPCSANCLSNYCSPECTYSDLYSGNCSSSCTTACLKYCNTAYCSPGCSYQDINKGICPDSCKPECCKQKINLKSLIEKILISSLIVLFLILIAILIYCLRGRIKLLINSFGISIGFVKKLCRIIFCCRRENEIKVFPSYEGSSQSEQINYNDEWRIIRHQNDEEEKKFGPPPYRTFRPQTRNLSDLTDLE